MNYGKLIDDATSELLLGPDWGRNLQICDVLSSDPESGREIIKHIRRRLTSKNPKVIQLTLTVLDSCIKNGPSFFHVLAGSRDMATLLGVLAEQGATMNGKPVAGGTAKDEVALAAATMLQELAIMFENHTDNIIMFTTVYNSLRSKGTVQFPSIDISKITRMVYAPVPIQPAMMMMTAPPPGMYPYPSSHGGMMMGNVYPSYQASHPTIHPSTVPYPSSSNPTGRPPSYPSHPNKPALSLESQLAIVDSAFDKLRHDLSQVTDVVRTVAKHLVNGTYGTVATNNVMGGSSTTNKVIYTEEFLDHIDMLQQVPTRLATLIEIGISGILDEEVFEQCLSLNDSVSRLLEICVPWLDHKVVPIANGSSSGSSKDDSLILLQLNPEHTVATEPMLCKYPNVQDLTKLGLPVDKNVSQTATATSKTTTGSTVNHEELSSLFGNTNAPVPPPIVNNDTLFDILPSSSSSSTHLMDFSTTTGKTSFVPVAVTTTTMNNSSNDFEALAPSSSTLNDRDFGSSTNNTTNSNGTANKVTTPATSATSAMPSSAAVLADLDDLLRTN